MFFFQSNPFDVFIEEEFIHFGLEDKTIEECWINSHWIRALYGEDYLQKIKNQTIINGGIIKGNSNNLKHFLDFVTNSISENSHLDNGNNLLIMEQSVPIKYCLTFKEKIKLHSSKDSKILTAGHSNFFTIDRSGLIVNDNKNPYSIIHQYDRFEILTHIINIKLSN
jgi:hypothetical protein